MSFIDAVLLTLLNAVACVAMPKLLSLILADKTENKRSMPPDFSM
jgi:hypothetical protein